MSKEILDREKLKEKMYFCRWNQQDLADFLKISRQSANLKLNGKTDFKEIELVKLKEKFGKSIFFIN